ncbi:hypothetical protein GCM10009737_22160 [Nocardioides lentus]|uniref:Glucanase n=1 Tax=Nocardioides lentus TaxID=338077 RepID=A0ABP5AQR7_9ACTN
MPSTTPSGTRARTWLVRALLLALPGALLAAAPAAPAAAEVDNSFTQPALVAYGNPGAAAPYAERGALVIAGRENYGSAAMKRVSRRGGTVLVYLDAVIDNDHGRYHAMLNRRSVCGPATRAWPGDWRANSYGRLNDFRPGSVVQRKLGCVLRRIVAENPHIAGFLADDLGSRSWFRGFSWDAFGARNRQAYRAGAIAAAKTFRRVADRHGLVFLVNGTWEGGSVHSKGGGYPTASASGNALADGTIAEHHRPDAFWGRTYPCARQWANASSVTRGTQFNFAIASTDADRRAFARSGCYAFAATQTTYERARVWGRFRPTGLPHRVTRP